MPFGAQLPSLQALAEIAHSRGYSIAPEELVQYRALFQGMIESCDHLEGLPERSLPVQYARSTGHSPSQLENEFNAWAWKCEISGASAGLLEGYKVGVKDSVCVAGVPMRNGSKILGGYTPDIDATVVTRVLQAGGTITGKTNCEDLCLSGAGFTSALGPVHNPYDPARNTGASSSGSAAVIACGDADVAIGGDQGGSIRIPAAWCGIVGLKPTYGLVSFTGCAMIEATLDHVGPMAKDAEGATRLLQAMAGFDPMDPRQRGVIPEDFDFDFLSRLKNGVRGKKIAIVREGFAHNGHDSDLPHSDARVDQKVRAAIACFERLGATVEEISIPLHFDAYHIWSVLLTLGSAQFMLDGEGLGSNWSGFYNTSLAEAFAKGKRAFPNDLPSPAILTSLIGEHFKKQYGGRFYWKAQNQRHLITDQYNEALARFDMLAMPTTPFVATKRVSPQAPLLEYISSSVNMLRNTCVANVTGHPSISLPCAMLDGLPVGLMLTGAHLDDMTLLQAAHAFEGLGSWKDR
jgi:amidase